MNCDEVKEGLSGFLESDLSEGRMAQIRDHLARCQSCSEERRRIEAGWELLRAWPEVEPSRDLAGRIWARIEQDEPVFKGRFQWGSWPTWAPVGGLVAATILITIWLVNPITKMKKDVVMLEADQTVIEMISSIELLEQTELFEEMELLQSYDFLLTIDENTELLGMEG